MGSVFSAIFVAIYTNKLPGFMNSIVVPALEKTSLPASSIPLVIQAAPTANQAALSAIPGVSPSILKIINNNVADAYGHSYAFVYYTAVALGGICIIAALCLRDFDHYLTDHVARQVYRKEETREDPLEKLNGDGTKRVSQMAHVEDPERA